MQPVPPPFPIFQGQPVPDASGTGRGQAIRDVAEAFEAAFLTEMLRHTGLEKMSESMNGGAGEAAFSSFLTRAYASEIARTKPLGIADTIAASLEAKAAVDTGPEGGA